MHKPHPIPSPLLALVAIALVHRLRPSWLAVPVGEAARSLGESPERISRLCSRLIGPLEQLLAGLTRRGRPRKPSTNDDELALSRALLAVTTALLAQIPIRRRALRELVVGAWLRLRAEQPSLTQERFCEALALPSRTLRAWLRRPAPSPAADDAVLSPGTPSKKRTRGLRRPRFRFDLVIPGVQLGADTTDLGAFGVPLKLVAAQDIGGRDERLFDAVVIDTRESSEHVVQALCDALAGREGMQVVTDQGSPYLAEQTRAALEQAGAELAAQREGDPLGKATVERAFFTLKSFAKPLLSITDRIAEAVPSLNHAELAKAAARVLLSAMLRAYQAGARAARAAVQARGGLDEEALVRAADRSREAARADERSRRLLLRHLHAVYAFEMRWPRFEREFVRYPLPVLREAETRLRPQLHRNDIRSLSRYFAALVRTVFAEYCAERRRLERDKQERDAAERHARSVDALHARRRSDPSSWLHEALDALAAHWMPARGELLFGGEGLGLGWLRGALARLITMHGLPCATDLITGALSSFRLAYRDRLAESGIEAVAALVHRELVRHRKRSAPSKPNCPPTQDSATLWNTGRTKRPPTPNHLRN